MLNCRTNVAASTGDVVFDVAAAVPAVFVSCFVLCVATLLNAQRYTCSASLRLLYLWCASNCKNDRERERRWEWERAITALCTSHHTETMFPILIITFSRAKQIIMIMLQCRRFLSAFSFCKRHKLLFYHLIFHYDCLITMCCLFLDIK